MNRGMPTIADRFRVVRDVEGVERPLPVTGWFVTHKAAANWIARNGLTDCRVQREGAE